MTIPLFHVSAFTDQPFAGNPAAVCLLEQKRDTSWMQAVARDQNLSETAFLVPYEGGFSLRWFTPKAEVSLCGHATLASAHILWELGVLDPDQEAEFDTCSGRLTADQLGTHIMLDFPAILAQDDTAPAGLLEALGLSPEAVVHTAVTQAMLLVEVASAERLRALAPDFRALARIADLGVVVTCRSDDPRFDFLSRFFAPGVGIDEDPVTGSAHCALAPYWVTRLGDRRLHAYQASARGGILEVEVREDRVLLVGQAITTMRGTLLV